MTKKVAKLALGATILAFAVTQLPLKAHVDVPLFYLASFSAIAAAALSVFSGVATWKKLKADKRGLVWLSVSMILAIFWAWFWVVSFHKRVG